MGFVARRWCTTPADVRGAAAGGDRTRGDGPGSEDQELEQRVRPSLLPVSAELRRTGRSIQNRASWPRPGVLRAGRNDELPDHVLS